MGDPPYVSVLLRLTKAPCPNVVCNTFRYSAWGLYGSDDQLGTLNRLTDDLVQRTARHEIQTGSRCADIAI